MVENKMIVDSQWRDLERTPKIVGECEGCGEAIFAGEDVYEVNLLNGIKKETHLLHQTSECCRQYVSEMAYCRVAGE
jgi:hypothetical protein